MSQPQQPPYRTAGVASAAGDLTLSFTGRSSRTVRVTQVAVRMPTGGGAICELYLDGAFITPLVPTGDAAGGDPPVWVEPGGSLSVVWTGAPAGAAGSITVLYDFGEAR